MALRHTIPLRWRPKGCSDALDGSNAFAGAMSAMTNLVPDTSTAYSWVPRPAAQRLVDLGAVGVVGAGSISGLLVVGDIAYGMVASGLHAGDDQPFAYNLATATLLTVAGITAGNVPTSPPTSGDWTPPILAQVAGRVIVTHPGFPGGTVKFGWFDISSASLAFLADTTNGDRYLRGNFNLLGVMPGMTLAGTGITAGTTVLATLPQYIAVDFTGDTHNGTTLVDGIASTTNLVPGLTVSGPNIQPGSTILSRSGTSITLSLPATGTASAAALLCTGDLAATGALQVTTTASSTTAGLNLYTGIAVGQGIAAPGIPVGTTITAVVPGTSISLSQAATSGDGSHPVTVTALTGVAVRMSANATSDNSGEQVIIAGGTPTAPLWGAGDTDRTPLPSQPVGVAQFNGRAYFALGTDGIVYSDSLAPCRVSNLTAVQALTTNDGLAVTAISPLLLSSPVTGGIVQALIAFEGTNKAQQITGDQATANLAINVIPAATGTAAPLSVVPTEQGLAFVSPEGLRFVSFAGAVLPPVGDQGQGIVLPFQFAASPSQICAAANSGILRLTVQNALILGSPYQEWWYDTRRQVWSGPHTFPARLIEPWRNGFVVAPVGVTGGLPGTLWSSDAFAGNSSSYVENGAALTWRAETVLLPDNEQMAMNAMVEGTIESAGSTSIVITVNALDEGGIVLDSVTVQAGGAAGLTNLRQRALHWHEPVVFKQMQLSASGASDYSVRLGNFYMRYEILGYLLDAPGADAFLLADDGVTVLLDDAGEPLVPG